uniref:RNA polymerase sigma factor n=1 Tax=Rhizobium meliloti TaxID=382 RepID=A0A0D4DD06_RHIML|nr:sigma-70 family RNA polymerase sigma factor [Sinorhizobium meliloti]AJT61572.1 RNA polymerase sigma factor [Sinorhizobium meliloti]
MKPPDITELIVRTAMKDREAFDALYRSTNAKLFGVCLRILNNRSEAEEVVQEVFVKIWTRADRFAVSELSPISWLVAIARHQAIDRVRVRRLPTSDLDAALNVSDSAPNPEMAVLAGSRKEEIDRCLDELEEKRGEAVRGAYLDGLSYSELAQRHRIPLNTRRTWLRRSLMKLKGCLER